MRGDEVDVRMPIGAEEVAMVRARDNMSRRDELDEKGDNTRVFIETCVVNAKGNSSALERGV